jgi:ABC-type microcin C transport system permease subunit YejB
MKHFLRRARTQLTLGGLLLLLLWLFGLTHTLLQLRRSSETPDDPASWAAVPIDIAIPSILLAILTTLFFVVGAVRAQGNRPPPSATLFAFVSSACWLAHDIFEPIHAHGWLVVRIVATLVVGALLASSLRGRSSP